MSQAPESQSDRTCPGPTVGVVRQTVEFLVVLCLCILVFRTFGAEAYIVPTGSMAPTLLGNHKELTCPNCGFRFALGHDDEDRAGRAACPNCGQTELEGAPAVACSGDRVLVQKFLYDFRRPKRWEVAVFHFPNDPSQAYVKRVVGLPNESIQVLGGDVYVDGRIARKTLKEQRAMRVLVYDHHFVPKDSEGFPRWRFRRTPADPARKSGWRADGTRFVHESPSEAKAGFDWLEYCHWDPDRGKYWPVYDYNSYNGADLRGENRVDDLMLEARLQVDDWTEGGQVAIRLRSGSDLFVVRISAASPPLCAVQVERNGRPLSVRGAAERRAITPADAVLPVIYCRRDDVTCGLLEASVMDHRLTVAVDGVPLFEPVDYELPTPGPGPGEHPVSVGFQGLSGSVSDLRIFRDVYYTSVLAHTPRRAFGVEAPYQLGPDEFFVLGDNSAVSNDSRFWAGSPVVPGALLLGKPFLVHLPGQVVPLQVFGGSVYWVPDPREIRYIR
ncbi:MAG: signal peptidase I [Isosphaeraceae bacterium]|nr:signal peptidase I [Isosphaeraceae bacterium]